MIIITKAKLKTLIEIEVQKQIARYVPPDTFYSLLIPGIRKIADERIRLHESKNS